MNIKKISVILLSLFCISSVQCDPADLVKTCQKFKKSFLEACQIIGDEQCTEQMKFMQTNLTSGGAVAFFEIIITAIDDCIKLLTPHTGLDIEELIATLREFKVEINSDEMYDLNTGSVFKKEQLRSGGTKLTQLPYNGTRCYRVAHKGEIVR